MYNNFSLCTTVSKNHCEFINFFSPVFLWRNRSAELSFLYALVDVLKMGRVSKCGREISYLMNKDEQVTV